MTMSKLGLRERLYSQSMGNRHLDVRTSRTQIFVGFAVSAAALNLVIFLLADGASPMIAVGAVIMLGLCVVIVIREFMTDDFLSPLAIFSVTTAVHFYSAGLLNASFGLYYASSANQKFIDSAILFVSICLIFYVAGYYVARAFVVQGSSATSDRGGYQYVHVLVCCILTVAGWVGRLLVIRSGEYFKAAYGLGSIELADQGWLSFLALLPDLGAAGFLWIALGTGGQSIQPARRSPLIWIVTLTTAVVSLVYWYGSGKKMEMITLFLVLIFIYYMKRKKIPVIFVFLAMAFGAIYFPLSFMVRTAQESLDPSRATNIKAILDDLSEALDHRSSTSFGWWEPLANRLNLTEPVAASIRLVEEDPMYIRNGVDYYNGVLALVPRVVWSDKPDLGSRGNEFGRDAWIIFSDYRTSISVTWHGESFTNFGWAGSSVFFLVGFVHRIFYQYTAARRKFEGVLIYAASIQQIAYIGSSLFLNINTILKFSFVLIIVFMVSRLFAKALTSRASGAKALPSVSAQSLGTLGFWRR